MRTNAKHQIFQPSLWRALRTTHTASPRPRVHPEVCLNSRLSCKPIFALKAETNATHQIPQTSLWLFVRETTPQRRRVAVHRQAPVPSHDSEHPSKISTRSIRVSRPTKPDIHPSQASIRVSPESMHSGPWAPGRRERARRAQTRRGGATTQGKPSVPRASEHRASSARLDAAGAAGRLQPLRPARRFPGPRRRRPLLRAAAGYRAHQCRRCEPAVARLVRRRQPAGRRTQAGGGRAAVQRGGPVLALVCVRSSSLLP